MIRQILNRFPRNKPSKSDVSDDGEAAVQTSRIVHKFSLDNTIKRTMGDDHSLALPLLKDVPSGERQELFVAKLSRCVPLGVSNLNDILAEKEAKHEILEELVDHIASGDIKFTGPIVEELFRMISANLFRALPPSPHENGGLELFDHGEEDPVLDPDWPLLRCIYELLLRFVLSIETDVKAARRYLDRSFILRLLGLFDSEDYREREYLKTILHRIYGKFMVHRPFIRKAINNIFYGFIFETERCNGIPELLEILGTVITGFAMPLKEEHKLFLVRALIPLHKPKSLPFYHPQLSYCITQFVEKDGELADAIIQGLLKYWPITNSRKEVMFLSELEEILEVTPPSAFQCSVVPLFRQISRCLNSSHFQVAERALFLWNNVQILNWVSQNRSVIIPLIFTALEGNSGSCGVPHWNPVVHGLILHARKALPGIDQELFRECVDKFQEEEAKAQKLQEKRERNWRRVEAMASRVSSLGAGETMVTSQ